MVYSGEDCFIFLGRSYSEIRHYPIYKEYFGGCEISGCDDRFHVLNRSAGIELIFTEELTCRTIFFFSGKSFDHASFSDALPFDLDFSMSQRTVHMHHGSPQEYGGGDGAANIFYGAIPPWDKYLQDGISIHVQYSFDRQEINLVTVEVKG